VKKMNRESEAAPVRRTPSSPPPGEPTPPLQPAPRGGDGDAGRIAAIVGFALGGVLILALGFWLGTRPRTPAIPQLTLVEPSPGEVVDQPLVVIFDVAGARIRIGPGGWGYGTLHLHVWVDELEIMPGPDDIEYVGPPARYRWTLSPVAPGERALRIGWSDIRHRPIEEGASAAARITIR
jgi:hypothetical protein